VKNRDRCGLSNSSGGLWRREWITLVRYSPPCGDARRGICAIPIRSHGHKPLQNSRLLFAQSPYRLAGAWI